MSHKPEKPEKTEYEQNLIKGMEHYFPDKAVNKSSDKSSELIDTLKKRRLMARILFFLIFWETKHKTKKIEGPLIVKHLVHGTKAYTPSGIYDGILLLIGFKVLKPISLEGNKRIFHINTEELDQKTIDELIKKHGI